MEEKEVIEALSELQTTLEGKTKTEIKGALDEFEGTNKKYIADEFKGLFEGEVKAVKEDILAKLKTTQDHLDILDVKLNKEGVKSDKKPTFQNEVNTILKDNFDVISKTSGKGTKYDIKANGIILHTKVVGDMTLGTNLTGDQNREYSNIVASVPRQLLNFSDLLGTPINVGVGTYTFPRETGSEGAIAFQTEGSAKSKIDYDFTMVDVNTDFLAGYARYSKKMRNNLPYLEGFLPGALQRDYFKQESTEFQAILNPAATASTEIITGQNKIEMLMNEVATLEGIDFAPNGITVRPSDYWDILKTEKSTGAGYGLPGVVALLNGVLFINGIPMFKANWLPANAYYVGDWTRIKKVTTEGLSLEFSTEDGTNFRDNMITARIEAQIGLAIERPDSIILGDFTAV